MERLGGYIIFFAIGSAVLAQTNYQFRLMAWMNDMGNGAWAVRALMLVVGVAMLASGQMAKKPAQVRRVAQPQAVQPQPVQTQPVQTQTVQPQPVQPQRAASSSPQPQQQSAPSAHPHAAPAPTQVIEF